MGDCRTFVDFRLYSDDKPFETFKPCYMTYSTLQEELDTLQTIGYTPFFQTDSYTLLFRVEDILQKNKYIYQLRVNYYKATHKA